MVIWLECNARPVRQLRLQRIGNVNGDKVVALSLDAEHVYSHHTVVIRRAAAAKDRDRHCARLAYLHLVDDRAWRAVTLRLMERLGECLFPVSAVSAELPLQRLIQQAVALRHIVVRDLAVLIELQFGKRLLDDEEAVIEGGGGF